MIVKTQHNTGILSKFNSGPAIASTIIEHYGKGSKESSVKSLRDSSDKYLHWNVGDVEYALSRENITTDKANGDESLGEHIQIGTLSPDDFSKDRISEVIERGKMVLVNINMWDLPKLKPYNEICYKGDFHKIGRNYDINNAIYIYNVFCQSPNHFLLIKDSMGYYVSVYDTYLTEPRESIYFVGDIIKSVRRSKAISLII